MSDQTWRSLLSGTAISERTLPSDAERAARELLGCYLVSTIDGEPTGGRIVETEAYLGGRDPASHASDRVGRTRRNAPMFGPSGTAYVYFIYGMHWCCNVVTGGEGDPQAVLLRAIEPVLGIERMRWRRGRDRDLTNGPARLCQALGIDGTLNGHLLDREPLLVVSGEIRTDEEIGVSARIGVTRAEDWPLRFFLKASPDVSRPRVGSSRSRAKAS